MSVEAVSRESIGRRLLTGKNFVALYDRPEDRIAACLKNQHQSSLRLHAGRA